VPGLLEQYRAYKERQAVRLNIMGPVGKGEQDYRKNTLTGTHQERVKQSTGEAVQRVGEYKQARKEQELTEIMGILDQHADKNFVQRIMTPEDYPKLYDNPGGETGQPSTHSMAWGEDAQGNAYVYPTVVQKPDGNLHRFSSQQEAEAYAIERNEFIPFGSDKEKADWFSKNYKQVWEQ
jgi:hypothetical protein